MSSSLSRVATGFRRLSQVRRCLTYQWQFSCCCRHQCTTAAPSRLISYLTDVEGDAAYLDRYVNQSKVLTFRETKPRFLHDNYFPYSQSIDFCKEDTILVYGGDAWDRGGSDLYVIRQLLDLKLRYPERVYFLMGNRDLNKMRILQELGLDDESMPLHFGIYWMKGTGRVGDPDLGGEDANVPQDSPVERLKWILQQTMGSPHAFELRRKELEREQIDYYGEINTIISDEDVVQSYRSSCHPNGEMGRYLANANLVVRLGKVAFAHGALPLTNDVLNLAKQKDGSPPSVEEAARFWSNFSCVMPWKTTTETVNNPNDWFHALNEFAKRNIENWRDSINNNLQQSQQREPDSQASQVWSTVGGYQYWPSLGLSFGALMQYGMGWTPDKKRNRTIVYSSWLTNGIPRRFSSETEDDVTFATLTKQFFRVANLDLFVSGHQPHGDLPCCIRVGHDDNRSRSSWILCCDTSYSGDTLWINDDNDRNKRSNMGRGHGSSGRGDVAVCEVLIQQCVSSGDVLGVKVHGKLSDGSSYEIDDLLQTTSPVGMPAPRLLTPHDGRDYWVKAKLANDTYLVTTGEGFNVWNYLAVPKT